MIIVNAQKVLLECLYSILIIDTVDTKLTRSDMNAPEQQFLLLYCIDVIGRFSHTGPDVAQSHVPTYW